MVREVSPRPCAARVARTGRSARLRWSWVGLVCLAVLLIPAARAIAAPRTVGHAGRWIVDPSGRVVIVHGVNLSSKGFGPNGTPATPEAVGFGPADARLLSRLGFDVVRLTFQRSQFEPEPGRFDDAYASQFARTVRMLWRRGTYSLIDFHQDEYGPVFKADGFPAWMTVTNGLPNDDTVPFPLAYFRDAAERRAWDNLWDDGTDLTGRHTLQADDATLLRRAVRDLRDVPGILGFEIINEPFAGTDDEGCYDLRTGCVKFEGKLSAYYRRTVSAIRTVDRTHLLFYEPQVGFDFSFPTNVRPPKDPKLGFAFHDYCVNAASAAALFGASTALVNDPCEHEDRTVAANALRQVGTTGSALLETEFGAAVPGERLGNIPAINDANMLPWIYWDYNALVGATAHGGEMIPSGPRTPNAQQARAIVRPYPQLIAGVPLAWSFDTSSKRFTLRYATRRADGHGRWRAGSLTTIEIPSLQYPAAPAIRITGGVVVSARRASHLVVAACPGASVVTVRVTQTGRSSNGCRTPTAA